MRAAYEIVEIPAQSVPMELLLEADPSEKMIRSYLETSRIIAAVIDHLEKDHPAVVGVIALDENGLDNNELKEIEIMNLAVVSVYRGQGIGTALLQAAISMKAYSGRKIVIKTGNSSIGQLALYQKIGFRIVAIEPNYFTRSYTEEIVENGIVCRDRVVLEYGGIDENHNKIPEKEQLSKTKLSHVNLIAKDWKKLMKFYRDVFGCEPVFPQRDLRGEWIDQAVNLPETRIRGLHMRVPGNGEGGPTIELFQYDNAAEGIRTAANTPGFSHIAFAVDDVWEMSRKILAHGGSQVGEVTEREIVGAGSIVFQYLRDPEGNILEIQKWES